MYYFGELRVYERSVYMRIKWKRILSMIVSVSLVVGLVPMSSYAETTEDPGVAEESQAEYPDLSKGKITMQQSRVGTTGEPVDLGATVYNEIYEALTEGEDFKFVFSDEYGEVLAGAPTEPGEYSVYAAGQGAYTGRTDSIDFTVVNARDIGEGTFYLYQETYEYTGDPVKLDPYLISFDSVSLTEGTDYEFVYYNEDDEKLSSAPSTEGKYSVYARGIGDYTGETVWAKFTIFNPKDLSRGKITVNEYYNVGYGDPVVPDVTVQNYELYTLTQGTDFELVYRDRDGKESTTAPAKMGLYYVYATGKGEYTGSTDKAEFMVYDGYDLTHGTVSLSEDQYVVSETPPSPEITVKDYSGKELTKGVDYTLLYYNKEKEYTSEELPVDIGQYEVYANGIGKYRGSPEPAGLTIYDPYSFPDFTFTYAGSDFVYDGEPVALTPMEVSRYDQATQQTVYLTEGTEYRVDHYEDEDGMLMDSAPSQVGSYTAVYVGIDPYVGIYKREFRITGNEYDFSNARLKLERIIYDYTGEEVALSYKVMMNGYDYIYNDYELVYFDEAGKELSETPKRLGTYQVAARATEGGGKSGETPKRSFYICGSYDIGNVHYTVKGNGETAYTGSPIVLPEVTIYYIPEHYDLIPDTDYAFDHFEDLKGNRLDQVIDAGSYYAVYKGIGRYTGYRKASITVLSPKSLENAEVQVDAYIPLIDGKASPTISVKDLEGNVLTPETDYTVTYICGKQPPLNVPVDTITEAGKYRVLIRPGSNGHYAGEVTADFTVYDMQSLECKINSAYYWICKTSETTLPVTAGQLPTVTFYHQDGDQKVTLTENTEYKLDRIVDPDKGKNYGTEFPDAEGRYRAYYTGISPYSGTREVEFTLYDPHNLNCKVSGSDYWKGRFTPDDSVESGADSLPAAVIYHGTETSQTALVRGKDFALDHIVARADEKDYGKKIPAGEGSYIAYYKGLSPYYGTIGISFTVYDTHDIAAEVEEDTYWDIDYVSGVYVVPGAASLPEASISHRDDEGAVTVLVEGTDYQLHHIEDADGKDYGKDVPEVPGKYTAYYTGLKPYKGTRAIDFEVYDPYDIGFDPEGARGWDGEFTAEATIPSGSSELPPPEIIYCEDDVAVTVLKEGTDYKLDRITDASGDDPKDYGKEVPTTPGEYLAYYTGIEPYKGEIAIPFTVVDIHGLDVSTGDEKYWNADIASDSTVYPGATSFPAPTIYHKDKTGESTVLSENVDYIFDRIENTYGDVISTDKVVPEVAGNYKAYFKGKGLYTGEIAVLFTVVDTDDLCTKKADSSYYWNAAFTSGDRIASGTKVLPAPVIYGADEDGISDRVLEEGKDYEFDHIEPVSEVGKDLGKDVPTEPGVYYAVYRGKLPYYGVRRISFTIFNKTDIGDDHWTAEYRGGETITTDGDPVILPELLIRSADGQKLLAQGEDFEFVRFESSANEMMDAPDDDGTYYAVYQGKGEYEGQRKVKFSVENSRNLRNGSISLDADLYPETGEPVKPAATVSDLIGNVVSSDDYQLVYYDMDGVELTGGAPAKQGEYYLVAKAVSGGRYRGKTERIYFTVGKVTYRALDPVTMSLNTSEMVSVKRNEEWTGVFKASAAASYTFASWGGYDTIGELYSDAAMTKLILRDEDGGDGKNFSISQTLTAGQMVYLKVYHAAHEAADFSVSVTTPDRYDLGTAALTIDEKDLATHGNVLMPVISVKDKQGTLLTEGKQYELQYLLYHADIDSYVRVDDVTKGGRYKVTAKAIADSGYRGQTGSSTFDATQMSDLSAATLSVADTFHVGDDVAAAVTVKDATGKVLTRGTDYDLTFYQIVGATTKKLSAAPAEAGKYSVAAVAAGSTFTGRTEAKGFSIVRLNDLAAGGSVALKDYSYTEAGAGGEKIPVYIYNGSPVTPGVTVTYNGEELSADKYTVRYENNTAATTGGVLATVTVTGQSTYEGSLTKSFMIVAKPGLEALIANDGFLVKTGDRVQAVAAGTRTIRFVAEDWSVTPVISIEGASGETYVQDQDFTIAYKDSKGQVLASAPTTAGSYKMVFTSTTTGRCKGTATVAFSLVYYNLEEEGKLTLKGYEYVDEVTGIPVYDYKGSAIEPEMTVKYGNTVLDTGDFTVSYTGNTAPTTGDTYATVTVTGKRPYEGSLTKKFRIVAKPTVEELIKENGFTVNGKAYAAGTDKVAYETTDWTSAPKVSLTDGSGKTYEQNKDFAVSFTDASGKKLDTVPSTAGSYKMVLTAVESGGCTGSATIALELTDPVVPEPVDISKAAVTLGKGKYTYNGSARNPGVKSVKLGDVVLVSGTDYTVTVPTGRKDAGTYTYTITGKGDYKGTVKASFKIEKANSSIKLAEQSKKYTGKALTYSGKVTKTGSTGKVTYTYYSDAKGKKTVKLTSVKAAKVYYVRANLAADKNYKAAKSALVKFTITKAANTMKVTKNKAVKLDVVKKKAQTVACITVKKAKGKVTYALSSVAKETFKKYFKVNAKNGKITLKKGTPKGTYTIAVKVTAKGNDNYKALSKKVTFKIVVK